MASQVREANQLANFKPSREKRQKEKNRDKRKDRPGNSEAHLAALRLCKCIATGKRPAGEVHHLKHLTGERGAGLRSSDKWGVPLSRAPHDEVERAGARNEWAVMKRWGILRPLDLAAALYAASPDIETMDKIIDAHVAEGAAQIRQAGK